MNTIKGELFEFDIFISNPQLTCLASISSITISEITLMHVKSKFGGVEINRKYVKNYSPLKSGGSNQYPKIGFRKFLKIRVKDFPRFPAFTQNESAAKDIINGRGYNHSVDSGFPTWIFFNHVQFKNIKRSNSLPNFKSEI